VAAVFLLLAFVAGCGQPGDGDPMGLTGGGENGYGGGILSNYAPPPGQMEATQPTTVTSNDVD
jgi:hypothetical protein